MNAFSQLINKTLRPFKKQEQGQEECWYNNAHENGEAGEAQRLWNQPVAAITSRLILPKAQ